jgi:hypothetical protein
MPGFAFDGGRTAADQVRDRRASAACYADVLGFRLRCDAECCEMAAQIAGVVDIAAAQAEMEAKGVRFDGSRSRSPAWRGRAGRRR